MARAAAVCEGAGVALGSAEGCSLGMGGAALGGQGWVRVGRGEGAERGQLDIGSKVWGPEYPFYSSGSIGRERNGINVYIRNYSNHKVQVHVDVHAMESARFIYKR